MSQTPVETFSVTRHAADLRADGAARLVRVSATRVTIERSLQGVRMKLGVPVSAYRGLVFAVRQPTGHATLTLCHEDSELDVTLGSGEAMELARKARAWSHLLGQPVRIEGGLYRDRHPAGAPPDPAQARPPLAFLPSP